MNQRRIFELCPDDYAVLHRTGQEGMLKDTHIYKIIDILADHPPYCMQSTLLIQRPDLIQSVRREDICLQILFHGPRDTGHWICVFYDTEVLHVYDSANINRLHDEHKIFLSQLLPYDNIRVVFERVQQQANYWDCGVFAIAFAMSIVHGQNPRNIVYDTSKMRSHLMSIFRSNRLTQFPILPGNALNTVNMPCNMSIIGHVAKRHEQVLTSVVSETSESSCERSVDDLRPWTVVRGKKSKIGKTHNQDRTATIEKGDDVGIVSLHGKDAARKRQSRANESQEQRTKRLEAAAAYKKAMRDSIKKANDTEAAIVRKKESDIKKKSRGTESEEQRTNRLKAAASYRSQKRKCSGKEHVLSSRTKKRKLDLDVAFKDRALITNLDLTETDVDLSYLGEMSHLCQFCSARHFVSELPSDKKYSICCHKGKVSILEPATYPNAIQQFINGTDVHSRNFLRNVRSYNNSLAFASFGAKLDSIKGGRGPFVFCICGQTYHNTYALHPDANEARKYGQLYIIDNEIATRRMQHPGNGDCLPAILSELDDIIRQINPYAEAFKMMYEMEEEERQLSNTTGGSMREIRMWLKRDEKADKNRFNLPTCNEVAIVFVAEAGDPPVQRDVCVYSKSGGAISIPSLSKHVDPMTYPLMFPSGETGWSPKMKQTEGNREITALQYYSYKLSDRGGFNPCLNMGKLSQQYIVDMWTKVESHRLHYIKNQQNKLRAELYKGVIDYLHNKAGQDSARIGKMVILPSSFSGSPRALQQSFIDAITILQKYGKPDLFITMTCNPKWREIVENLKPVQTATDRPDLVARVFAQKVKELKAALIDEAIFGKCVAYVYVIEFQKRGLPHVHLLFWLEEDSKIRDADDVDKIVSAEIPDKTRHPLLYEIIKQCMIHGPCGEQNVNSPCMDIKTNRCTKRYPKDFISETNYTSTGYPLYRRRDDGNVIFDSVKGGVRRVADNRSVVPYNAYLLLKFNCHINVEVCTTVQCIKYLFKYCYKGHDCAVVEMKDAQEENSVKYDEVDEYISTRYVCPPEAMHRLYQFPMNEQSHAIYRLSVHIENEHTLYFEEGRENVAVDRNKESTLLAWLSLNKTDVVARNYLYSEIPTHYVFNKKNTEWTKRKKYVKPVLSRMYFVSPRETERYYLRLLLLHVRGAQSYDDLRTYEGTTYPSFLEAAVARKLVTDDEEWDKCLAEGSSLKFPKEMCRLFAYICVFGMPINARELFEKYKYELVDRNEYNEENEQEALKVINEILIFHGLTLQKFNLPDLEEGYIFTCVTDNDEDVTAIEQTVRTSVGSLTKHQRIVYDTVMRAVRCESSDKRIYVDGPGGSGKSYLHNTIITTLRSMGLTALPVAWTGIAANLLKGGRTAHSTFKLPLQLNESSTCNIKSNSRQGLHIRNATVIIWDEITMASKYALEAVDRMLRDVCECNEPFGGKVVIIPGDFRQTLPVVRRGSRTQILEACVKRSSLWNQFVYMSLKGNIRVSDGQTDFKQWLLRVGDGVCGDSFERNNEVVSIPKELCSNGDIVLEIFGETVDPQDPSNYGKVILAPTNVDVIAINNEILSKIRGVGVEYLSVDTGGDEDNTNMSNILPIEFMNSLTPNGLPPHNLTLKVGSIVILLRNLNLSQGLRNGTRLVVKKLNSYLICTEIISGNCAGETVLIPRIDLTPSEEDVPFKMVRRQFPVRLGCAMTINKSRGQSFDSVGVYLPNPVFSHGQLYVALSRVKSKNNLKVLLTKKSIEKLNGKVYTRNIVYKEILGAS